MPQSCYCQIQSSSSEKQVVKGYSVFTVITDNLLKGLILSPLSHVLKFFSLLLFITVSLNAQLLENLFFYLYSVYLPI